MSTSTTPPLKRLIVTGATGKQGGALISALLSNPTHPFEIYAVTRNASSPSALKLASQPNVKVIEGNFSSPADILAQVKDPWGLFSVTMPESAKKEEAEGKAMTEAAVAAGVKHIVFTSVDRGVNTETDPTPIPHFASKFNIERDIIAKSKEREFTYTFLRPACFFDNLSNDFTGKGFVAMWRLNGPNTKLQFIGTPDIGRVAAEAFLNAESPEYRNQGISLAGDEITPVEAARIFKEVTGREIPATFGILGRILRWVMWEQLGIMFNWFKTDGYGVPVPALRQKYPFVKDFRAWLETESAWKKR